MALIAIPLWKRGITTLADLFRQRYGISVERVAALILAPSSLIWAAAQIRAFGQIIAASSTLPVETAIIIAATVIILYTVLGGMLADAITDFICLMESHFSLWFLLNDYHCITQNNLG
jgi:Na+/proline symporter